MRIRVTAVSFFVIGLVFLPSLFAQNSDAKIFHPLSGRFSVGLEGGATYSRTDFKNSGFDYITRGSFDYFFPSTNQAAFGIKVFGGFGYINGDGYASSEFPNAENFRSLLYYLGAGGTFNYEISKTVIPYLMGGISYLYFDPKDKDGNNMPVSTKAFSPHKMMFIGELGFRFLLSDNLGLTAGTGVDYVNSDKLDNVIKGTDNDIFFHAMFGLTYYFSGIKDTDGDGVRDKYDQCPDTPPNVTVDEFGCPVDADKDGVPDYMDQCPHTPANITVDANGCPVDADQDGVPDYLDLCKDTPSGVKVDSRGCPTDSDEDGIPDYKDLCPNTQIGTEVNKWGCPIEEKVYEPIKKTEFILSGGINFELGKADLLSAAYPELEKIVKVMSDYPDTKWKIEGHTDNTGSAKINKELSLQRAKSVFNFFISRGVDAKRLSANGFGPDFPIAENNTETGKALNRRVAIILVSGNNIENSGDVKTGEVKTNEVRKYNSIVERNVGNMIFTDGYLYCFQVSSWRSRIKAEAEMKRMQSAGYNSFIVIAELPELDGTWYRVRIGYFNSLDEAIKVKSKM